MANQYSRKSYTEKDLLVYRIENLEARNAQTRENLWAQINQLKEALVKSYRNHIDPDVCKVLVMHGVDVWEIDRELGRKTVYTTGRLKDKAAAEGKTILQVALEEQPPCPDCNDTGVVPNPWGTGEASGGYGDYCECKQEEQSA